MNLWFERSSKRVRECERRCAASTSEYLTGFCGRGMSSGITRFNRLIKFSSRKWNQPHMRDWLLLPCHLVKNSNLWFWFNFRRKSLSLSSAFLFYKMDHSRPLFLYFVYSIQLTVNNVQCTFSVPMTWFELRTSGVGSDRSTNWAKTTSRNSFPPWLTEPILAKFGTLSVNYTWTRCHQLCCNKCPWLVNNYYLTLNNQIYWFILTYQSFLIVS